MRFDPIDSDLSALKWSIDSYGYPFRNMDLPQGTRPVRAHRIVLSRMLGRWPKPSEHCDHINTDKMDNRRVNLRIVNQKCNNENLPVHGVRGYRGTSLDKRNGRWRAYAKHNGNTHSFGYHDTEIDAAIAAAEGRIALGFSSAPQDKAFVQRCAAFPPTR